MSKKFRVLMLSVIAVLFAVASAFAITASDLSVTTSSEITPQTTEGYNYYQVVYLDTSSLTDVSIDVVSWEVYPSGDISWLTWTLGSLDVVINGRLPAYDTSENATNEYYLHVIAHYASGDVEVQSGDDTVTISGDISADVDGSDTGLTITVDDPSGYPPIASRDIAIFSDLVSVDYASSERGLDKATSNYSVTVNFLTTTQQIYSADLNADEEPTGVYTLTSADGDIFVNAQLASDDELPDKINLPSWLKYEVLSAAYDLTSSDEGYTSEDTTPYVRSLRIFYSSDRTPAANAPGAIYITTIPNSSNPVSKDKDDYYTETTTYDSKYTAYASEIVMGWTVNYYEIPAVSVDLVSYDITVKYGASEDIGVSGDTPICFYKQVPVSITFSPDISADVAITASWDVISSDTDNAYGKITLNVEPITPLITTYSTDMIITDSYDNTAAITLYINVSMDAMLISPDTSASVSVDVGASKDVSFVAYNFNGSVKSWDLGTIPSGITVTPVTGLANATRYNDRIVYTVAGVTEGRYSFDITAVDSFDRSADITVNVTVSTRPLPPVPGVSFSITPESTTVTVAAGASRDVSFTASNNSGDVTWTLGTVPSGVTVTPTAAQTGTSATYTVTGVTSGDYTVTVTATDAAGRTSNATMSITVTDSSTSFSISASTSSVTVAEGSTANVTFNATGNSGLVTWTAGTPAGGFAIAPATNISYVTQYMTTMVYTVTGITAGSGSVTITATDAAGNTDSETISITVTGSGGGGSEAGNTPAGPLSDATKAAVAVLVGNGMLADNGTDGGTLPEKAVQYPIVNPLYVTLSRSGTTSITKSSDINPIDLKLSFDVDIWRIYINNAIVAWAYSPGVTPAEFGGKEEFSASAGDHSGSGIEILPQSKSEAQINITPANMPTGNNVIASAFVLDIASPDQEIGKTTIATVNVSGSSTGGEDYGVGSSSGGCSAGIGAIVSALAAAFFISKKRS